MEKQAVAVFNSKNIQGEVVFSEEKKGIRITAEFTKLPKGKHGFHIHRAGDLRGEGCQGACEHYHKGHHISHGGPPDRHHSIRHTGDLGNIQLLKHEDSAKYTYFLEHIRLSDLYGRSVIIHADEDDLGKGDFEDSKITGHSGARIGCAIIGRVTCHKKRINNNKTRKQSRK
jgi:Cu-Zn family superoxide dismutase